MHQKLLKSAHYIELGSYQYWPVLVPRGIRLYTYEQIPVSLKDNPYITDGYRAYLPSRLCIKRYGVAAAAAGGAGALLPTRPFCRGSLRRPEPGVPTWPVPPIPSPASPLSLPVFFPRPVLGPRSTSDSEQGFRRQRSSLPCGAPPPVPRLLPLGAPPSPSPRRRRPGGPCPAHTQALSVFG